MMNYGTSKENVNNSNNLISNLFGSSNNTIKPSTSNFNTGAPFSSTFTGNQIQQPNSSTLGLSTTYNPSNTIPLQPNILKPSNNLSSFNSLGMQTQSSSNPVGFGVNTFQNHNLSGSTSIDTTKPLSGPSIFSTNQPFASISGINQPIQQSIAQPSQIKLSYPQTFGFSSAQNNQSYDIYGQVAAQSKADIDKSEVFHLISNYYNYYNCESYLNQFKYIFYNRFVQSLDPNLNQQKQRYENFKKEGKDNNFIDPILFDMATKRNPSINEFYPIQISSISQLNSRLKNQEVFVCEGIRLLQTIRELIDSTKRQLEVFKDKNHSKAMKDSLKISSLIREYYVLLDLENIKRGNTAINHTQFNNIKNALAAQSAKLLDANKLLVKSEDIKQKANFMGMGQNHNSRDNFGQESLEINSAKYAKSVELISHMKNILSAKFDEVSNLSKQVNFIRDDLDKYIHFFKKNK